MANGVTKRDSNLYKDVLLDAVSAAFAGRKALLGTGAAILVPNLPTRTAMGTKVGTGTKIQIPYFDSLADQLEDVTEGQGLTPKLLTSTQEESSYVHSGIAAEITDWAQIAAQAGDPYAEVARQYVELAMRRMDKGLIDKALATTLIQDNTGSSITEDAVTDARSLWGDEDSDIVLFACHSKVIKSIRKLKDSTGRRLYNDPQIGAGGEVISQGTFMGIPVLVTDRLTPTGNVYPSLIAKRGALVAWYNGDPMAEEDRDILTASDVSAMHLYHVEHMYKRPRNGTKAGVVLLKTTET